MPVLYIYDSPDAKTEIYDRLSSQLMQEGPPPGGLLHVAGTPETGGLVVVEVWDSEESHDRFDKIRTERIAAAGGPPRPAPRKMTVRNMVSPQTANTRI